MYDLSDDDVSCGHAEPKGALGILASAVEVASHPLLAQLCGRECCNLRTRSDGACGLHSAFGRLINGEPARVANVRRVAATTMETYVAEVIGEMRQSSRWLRHTQGARGEELCTPCATAELGFIDAQAADEPWCFWEELAEADKDTSC